MSASLLTMREGRRFVSRDLTPQEAAIVSAALNLWSKVEGPKDWSRIPRLRNLLAQKQLRAMHSLSFTRAEERGTYGYTDERGRILLNPNLCFANHQFLGVEPDSGDLVATASTLFHESSHLLLGASEAEAYQGEWLFLRRLGAWAQKSGDSALCQEVLDWEQAMPQRIEIYVGKTSAAEIKERVEHAPQK